MDEGGQGRILAEPQRIAKLRFKKLDSFMKECGMKSSI